MSHYLPLININMQNKITLPCNKCKKTCTLKQIYRFSWRYNDKTRVYQKSKRKIIHTGYKYLCKKCISTIAKI